MNTSGNNDDDDIDDADGDDGLIIFYLGLRRLLIL